MYETGSRGDAPMTTLADWLHDDITWCSNQECANHGCDRHLANKRIKNGIFSCSDFTNTDECRNITKVIFLDVNGVLNDSRTKPMIIGIDKAHVRQLKQIVDATGAEIVLTSTWKNGWEPNRRSTQQPTPYGKYLANKLFNFKLKPIDKTTDNIIDRGTGIKTWLNHHPWVKNYVVIDDDVFRDYDEEIFRHFVHTHFIHGLTDGHVENAISILNMKEN